MYFIIFFAMLPITFILELLFKRFGDDKLKFKDFFKSGKEIESTIFFSLIFSIYLVVAVRYEIPLFISFLLMFGTDIIIKKLVELKYNMIK